MRPVEDRFESHLVEGESVRTLDSGRLLEDAIGSRTVIGLTDRRLLCVSTSNEFVDVRYDYICSIRSRERSKVTYRSPDGPNRLTHLVAGLVALVVLAVGVVETTTASAFQGVVTGGLAAVTIAVAVGIDRVRNRPGVARAHEPVLVGAGVLALVILVVLGLVATSTFAPLFALVTLGGLALVGYAFRYRTDLGNVGFDRRRETHLSINTVDGETIRFVVDVDSELDRELSVSVHQRDPDGVELSMVRSPSD
ncbi:hypothetical protein [Natronorubrum sp. FCH18a]|uniref:hypothetical protein n=1 Tax=Natronorubrum sp. FCH18a TaxID=3447018 RepID=UPI003F517093